MQLTALQYKYITDDKQIHGFSITNAENKIHINEIYISQKLH